MLSVGLSGRQKPNSDKADACVKPEQRPFRHVPKAEKDSLTVRFGVDTDESASGMMILDEIVEMLLGDIGGRSGAYHFYKILNTLDVGLEPHLDWKEARSAFTESILRYWKESSGHASLQKVRNAYATGNPSQKNRIDYQLETIGFPASLALRHYLNGTLAAKDISRFIDTMLSLKETCAEVLLRDYYKVTLEQFLPANTPIPMVLMERKVLQKNLLDTLQKHPYDDTKHLADLMMVDSPQELEDVENNLHFVFPYGTNADEFDPFSSLGGKSTLGQYLMKAWFGDEKSATEVVTQLQSSNRFPQYMDYLASKMHFKMDEARARAANKPMYRWYGDNAFYWPGDKSGRNYPAFEKAIRPGHYPLLSEFFLALNAPVLVDDKETLEKVVDAIKSIEYPDALHRKVSEKTVNNWARIGQLTHATRIWDTRFWKDDFEGERNSLLSLYGFQGIANDDSNTVGRASDKVFGPGYAYQKGKTLIEFRQSYLLASHPDIGTLLIRNSAHGAERSLTEEPAYFSPQPLSGIDLQTFAPKASTLEKRGFKSVLDAGLNRSISFENRLSLLLDELMKVKQAMPSVN